MEVDAGRGGDGADGPKPGDDEVVVNFVTDLPEIYEVPDAPIVVPARLARYGLSEVVNQMLGNDPPVPFDFLVNGEFLRMTLGEHLEATKRTAETALTLEYVLALGQPESKDVDEAPDWISGIAALGGPWFAAVSYDGTARLYDDEGARLTLRLADAALVGAASFVPEEGGGSRLCAASKDGTLRCCSLAHPGGHDAPVGGPVAALRNSTAQKALQAAAFSEDGALVAGGGWDCNISVWNADAFAEPEVGQKRKAVADGQGGPKFTLAGHSQCVTCLEFGAKARFPFTLFSGSWDCSVRVWDVAAAACVCQWPAGRAVTSLAPSHADPPLLCTAHEDGHVTLWDVRASPHASAPGSLHLDSSSQLSLRSAQTSHRRLAAQVLWCPTDANCIASVGHDGRLCILDPRSPSMPLQVVPVGKQGACPNKILCAAWLGADTLISGGSDGVVRRHKLGTAQQGEVVG